jgi:threonine aldolase
MKALATPSTPSTLPTSPTSPTQALPSYGLDAISDEARSLIRTATAAPNAAIRFLSGGTQTNALALDTMLPRYCGIIAASTAHIANHEAGAIEFTGHKVLTLPSYSTHTNNSTHANDSGKISATELAAYLGEFHAGSNREYMVQPGAVYVTYPTELGTLYTAAELREIATICKANDLLMYLDGARMAYGLASPHTDVTLPLIAELCDAFCIGGTKCGAMFGEALVFPDPAKMPAHFDTSMRQHGALMAKGWLVAQQFRALFDNGGQLYRHYGLLGDKLAQKLERAITRHGLKPSEPVQTNQVFATVSNAMKQQLAGSVAFADWRRAEGDNSVIRFVTSWANSSDDIAGLDRALEQIAQKSE